MADEEHKIGDEGEPCLACGGYTVYVNRKHTMCRDINCPLMYKPQQWYKVVDGEIVTKSKDEL